MMAPLIDHYAVFGNPIAHSKSPLLQAAFAEQTQQTIEYTAQCVDIGHFNTAADTFFSQGGKGLNVTVPFKLDAFNYASQLNHRAQRAGAVNTLSINSAGIIIGDNTDGIGMINDISRNLGWPLKNKRVLLLGAGGAVRGVLEPLIQAQVHSITIANRTLEKAVTLAADFSDTVEITPRTFSELSDQEFDVIINGTSASLSGDLPPLPSKIIRDDVCCYDMMYSKELTPFLNWCQQQGAKKVSDGLGMLVCQGAESFFIWRGIKPETKPVIDMLRKSL